MGTSTLCDVGDHQPMITKLVSTKRPLLICYAKPLRNSVFGCLYEMGLSLIIVSQDMYIHVCLFVCLISSFSSENAYYK